ncbi:MAG: hypothetical protein PWQ32_411 [Thermococcaceae archaeon]|nr:hypothetical protein [Thermococcaceae archaeon]
MSIKTLNKKEDEEEIVNLSYDYILVSAVKNEAEHLAEVIESVCRQTIKPKLWVIVDDGSTDETPKIIDKYKKEYDWIKSISLPIGHQYDIFYRYAYVCKLGFEYAINYCRKYGISYDFIGLLDGDTVIEEKYFEKLIDEFKKDPALGIASGGIYYESPKGLILEKTYHYFARGTGRLWRKECFFDTGGYLLEPSPDTISNILAISKGYKSKRFDHIIAIQKRKTGSRSIASWKNYLKKGELEYYFDKHPILVLLNAIYLTRQYPFYGGIPYLIGYISSILKRAEKIRNPIVRHYFRHKRIKEIFRGISSR